MHGPTVVEEILLGALERPEGPAREAFLDDACRGDAGLRAEVGRLVLAHERGAGRLEPPARHEADPDPDGDRTEGLEGHAAHAARPAPREAAGLVIAGRYKLLEPIGEGGMGSVWLAEQTRPVRRKVAVKLIKAGMDSRQVLARFEAERQALALMDHPNIARVLDAGADDDGRPFFVMEYVKGVPITDYCDRARLTIPERLGLFVPVCQAVQHAHHKGVVHRDLKPSNVLVCLYDDRPVPKVIDFGLAKAVSQPLTEQTLFTAHGAVLGTPLYMSPEQATLNNLDVDTRTDVYSLGVILYELLTGTTPLERGRVQEAAWHELLRLIQEEEPPRPSLRLSTSEALPSLATLRGTEPLRLSRMLRGELDWILLKSLEKDRSRRYGTPAELAAEVERHLRGDLVQARPPSAGYRLRKFARKHRAAVAVSLTFAAILIGATAVSARLAIVARRAKTQAVAERNDALEARRAESEARNRAETQAYALRVMDRRRHLDQSPDDPGAFLALANLLNDPVPEGAKAWVEHLSMAVLLAGQRFAPPTRLVDHGGQGIVDAFVSTDQRRVVTQAEDGTIELREFPGLNALGRIDGVRQSSNDEWSWDRRGIFLGGDRLIATVLNDRQDVILWDTQTGKQVGPNLHHPGQVDMISPLGPTLRLLTKAFVIEEKSDQIETGRSYRLFFWEAGTEQPVSEIVFPINGGSGLQTIAVAPDGSWIACCGQGTLSIRSGRDGSTVRDLPGYEDVRAMAVDDSSRYLAVSRVGEMRFLDSSDWDRPPEVTRWPGNDYIANPEWVAGSDRLVRAATEWYDSELPNVGVLRGRATPLGFNPFVADEQYLQASDGRLYRIDTGERVAPEPGRSYPEAARRFAIDGRWIALPGLLIDLEAGLPLALPIHDPGIFQFNPILRLDGRKADWCHLAWAKRQRGRPLACVWTLPGPTTLGPRSVALALWAEVIAVGQFDGVRGFRPLTKAEWDDRRTRLTAQLAESGSPALPGFDPSDQLYWLRRQVFASERQGGWRVLPLLDQLVAEEPIATNLLARAEVRAEKGDDLGAMVDYIDATRAGGPATWNICHPYEFLYDKIIPMNKIVNKKWHADEIRCVLEFIDAVKGAPDIGPSFLNYSMSRSAIQGLALYRLDRYEEAIRALPVNVDEDIKSIQFYEILVRAMARFQMGHEAEARADYEAAMAHMEDRYRDRYPALLDEAAALFEP